MKFKLNNIPIESPEPEQNTVEFFKLTFNLLNADGTLVLSNSGEVWKKVGNLNKCFVLMNPQSTFNGQGKHSVMKNAFHIATAFQNADVYCPYNDYTARHITEAVSPKSVQVHFHLFCCEETTPVLN